MSLLVDSSPHSVVVEASEVDVLNRAQGSRIGEPRQRPARWELVALVALLAADALWTASNSRQWWFVADFWHFAGREGAGSWFGHHGGHLNVFNVAVARLVVADGFDYWPFWGLLRTFFSTAIGLSAWFALQRSGTRPLIALSAAVAITTFWYDVFITVVLVNLPITLVCLALVSHLVSQRRRWGLTIVSSVGIAAGSTMVLGVVAMMLVIVRRPRHRALLPWLAAPLLPYGLWYWFVRPSASPTGDLLAQTDVPAAFWSILEAGLRTYLTGVPLPSVVVSGLAAILLIRQMVRFLGPNPIAIQEEFFTLTLLLLLAAIFRDRVLGGLPGTAPRYGFHLTYFLVMAVASSVQCDEQDHRRRLRQLLDLIVLAALVSIPVIQLDQRTGSYQWGQNVGAEAQVRVEAAGYLLRNGADHYPDQGYLPGPEGGGALQVADLVRYVESGWQPQSPGPIELDRAQADLLTATRQIATWAESCEPGGRRATGSWYPFTNETTLVVIGPVGSEARFEWIGEAFAAPAVVVERLPATGAAEIRLKASAVNSARLSLGEGQQLCRAT